MSNETSVRLGAKVETMCDFINDEAIKVYYRSDTTMTQREISDLKGRLENAHEKLGLYIKHMISELDEGDKS